MENDPIPSVDSDPLLSRILNRVVHAPTKYGNLEDMRDIQALERRFGNRADSLLLEEVFLRLGKNRHSFISSEHFQALYVSGHLHVPDVGSSELNMIRDFFKKSDGFPYRSEALSYLMGTAPNVTSPVKRRVQTLFLHKCLEWPDQAVEDYDLRMKELTVSLRCPEFALYHPLSSQAALRWLESEGKTVQGDYDAIQRYNEFRERRDQELLEQLRKNQEKYKEIEEARAQEAREKALRQAERESIPPPAPLSKVELVMQALSVSNRLPPRLSFGLGDGGAFNVGQVLLDDETPIEVFKLAFKDPLQINRVRTGWTRLTTSKSRNALSAVCRRSTGKNPSKTWKARLDVLLEVMTDVELVANKTNPLHVLAGASFSSPVDRLSGMRAIERLYRKAQERKYPDIPTLSAWMLTDSSGATPFMRAVRAGCTTLAHALFLIHPSSAMADDDGEVVSAIVSHLQPMEGEKLLLAIARRRPSEMTQRHIRQAMNLVEKTPSLRMWEPTLLALDQVCFSSSTIEDSASSTKLRRAKSPEIMPGYGVTLHVLRGPQKQAKRMKKKF